MEPTEAGSETKGLGSVVQIDECKIQAHLDEVVRSTVEETLSYYAMPSQHWRSVKTNNPQARLMREIQRRTCVAGAFPDGKSALMLIAARLRYVAAIRWGTKRYLQMNRVAEVVAIA
jgi:putative transposase